MKLTDFILSDANLILLHILISGVIVSNVDFLITIEEEKGWIIGIRGVMFTKLCLFHLRHFKIVDVKCNFFCKTIA